jgi:hypothetical protein
MSFWSTGFLANGFSEARRALARLLAAFTCCMAIVKAQGFVNLDFELGKTPAGYVSFNTSAAERQILLPGWTTFYAADGVEPDLDAEWAMPLLNRGDGDFCIGSPCIWVRSSGAPHGKHFLDIDSGGTGDSFVRCGVWQAAVVPEGSKSLVFDTTAGSSGQPPFDLTFNGVSATIIPIARTTNGWTTYATDASPLSGRMVKVAFATQARGTSQFPAQSYAGLDNVRFVVEQVLPVSNPNLEWHRSGDFILINYTGILQQASYPNGEFIDVPGALSPYWVYLSGGAGAFFRTRN